MSVSLRYPALLGTLLFAMACNGAKQPTPAVPDESAPPAPGRVVEGDESFDVSPVTEPGPLLAHVRWKNPGANMATLARIMRMPPALASSTTRALIEGGIDELLGEKVDAKVFAELVEMDAPIDVVVVFDTSRGGPVPEPITAVSMGLTSIARARDASRGRPHKLAEGVWRVGPPAQPWESVCAIAASAGKTPARLVCSDGERELTRIAPYVARNVPAIADPPSDIRAQVTFRPLFDKYGRQWATQARGLPVLVEDLKQGNPRFDEALIDAATALAAEAGALMQDADKVTLDATINESEGMVVSGTIAFADKKSWLVQTLVDGAAYAGPAPDLFWHAPASSELVSYTRSGDPKRYEDLLDTARRLVEGLLEREKVGTAADRKAIAKLLRLPFKKGAATVVASGHFPASGQGNLMQDAIDAALGWHIIGVDDAPASIKGWLDDLLAAYNRQGLQSYLKKELGSDAKNLPIVKKGKAPEGLGGATALEIRVANLDDPAAMMAPPPSGGAPPKPKTMEVAVHLLLVPDGQRTWLGIASDRDGLGRLMKTVKGQKPGAESIAGRGDLAMFRTGKHVYGGFTTLDGVIRPALWPILMVGASGGFNGKLKQILERMPHKGTTPLTFFSDANASARPQMKVHARVARETLIDVGFLITQAAQLSSRP